MQITKGAGKGGSCEAPPMVSETPILPAHIEDTLRAIAKLHADHRQEAGALQRLVEGSTAWIGRPQFVASLTAAIGVWVGGNLLGPISGIGAWDAPPFGWLQGVLGL